MYKLIHKPLRSKSFKAGFVPPLSSPQELGDNNGAGLEGNVTPERQIIREVQLPPAPSRGARASSHELSRLQLNLDDSVIDSENSSSSSDGEDFINIIGQRSRF